MEFDLKSALERHRRARGVRMFFSNAVLPIALLLAWYLDFSKTDTYIFAAIACVIAMLGHLEVRLKVAQLRLASIADELVAMRGKEPEGNELLELNDW